MGRLDLLHTERVLHSTVTPLSSSPTSAAQWVHQHQSSRHHVTLANNISCALYGSHRVPVTVQLHPSYSRVNVCVVRLSLKIPSVSPFRCLPWCMDPSVLAPVCVPLPLREAEIFRSTPVAVSWKHPGNQQEKGISSSSSAARRRTARLGVRPVTPSGRVVPAVSAAFIFVSTPVAGPSAGVGSFIVVSRAAASIIIFITLGGICFAYVSASGIL